MLSSGRGRPRILESTRPGATAREEILDAAAELFTTRGYATTTTRAIADAVGMRQASLYHHFATKDDLLAELLSGTVTGSLEFGRRLLAELERGAGAAPAACLHALAIYDGTQLCTTRWNLGLLYHLPELRSERFSRFLQSRQELRDVYSRVGAALADDGSSAKRAGGDAVGELAFRLVESLVNLRADGLATAESPSLVADACLRLAAPVPGMDEIREESRLLVSRPGTQL